MNDESALLSAAKKLDKKALTIIFDTYAPAIYAYVLRFCQDPIDSDKIIGSVFTQLLDEFATGHGPLTGLRSYLYKIAYRFVIDRPCPNQHFANPELVMKTPSKMTTVSSQTHKEALVLTDALISALHNELSDLERHVVVLRFLEDFSLRETAAIIGKTVNQIKVIQNRGIAKLQQIYSTKV